MKRLGPFKLRRDAVQRFYDIHSWLGILGGLALFVCVYSGTLALFEVDLVAWERPETRFQAENAARLDLDTLLGKAQDHLGTEGTMFVALPGDGSGGLQARSFKDGEVHRINIDPYSGAVVESGGQTAFAFLTHLHTDLHLPRPFGRYLVGLLGIVLLMSLISGVMAHPKIVKDVFLLRWRPSLRLTFSDLHKQVGVWGLAFGLVMAFTGAVIGLLGLFAPIMVLSAFGGDVEKATEAFSGPNFKPAGVEAVMLPIGPLVEQIEEQKPGFEAQSLFFRNWGDEAAEVAINLERSPYGQLTAGETHRVSLVDGEVLYVSQFTERGIGSRLFGAMQPVHYAHFGGLGLKLLYFVSGLVLSLGIVTGTLIWLERRKPAKAERRGQYFWLGRLHLGVSLGLVLASVLALAAGRFKPSAIEPAFWSAWLLLTIVAFLVRSAPALTRSGVLAIGCVLSAVAIADLLVSPTLSPTIRQVDLVFLVLGLLTLAAGTLSPRLVAGRRSSAPRNATSPVTIAPQELP